MRNKITCLPPLRVIFLLISTVLLLLLASLTAAPEPIPPAEPEYIQESAPTSTAAGTSHTTQNTISPEMPAPLPPTEPIPTLEPIHTPARYELTAGERALLESVLMAECGGESYEGQIAVAQCILNACEKDGIRPGEVVVKYKYTKSRQEPNESVKAAVSAVFDAGETAVQAVILYFYNPDRVRSDWHESQAFVITIGGHRFFKEVN